MHGSALPVPVIQVNGLDVVEILATKRPKKHEDPWKRRRRKTQLHDLKTCGCDGRTKAGSKVILDTLYKIASQQRIQIRAQSQHFEIASSKDKYAYSTANALPTFRIPSVLPGSPYHGQKPPREPPSFRKVSWARSSKPRKRTSSIAFPSSYFDPEACLNFYRGRALQPPLNITKRHRTKPIEQQENDDERKCFLITAAGYSSDRAADGPKDDTVSEAGSDTSISSVQSIDYDFVRGPIEEITKGSNSHITNAAPHRLDPTNGLLHPSSAEQVKRTYSPSPHTKQPPHILCKIFPDLASAPAGAFDEVTGGLRRQWLREVNPAYFDIKGELQEYVIHRGRPEHLSRSFWIWLCGRDEQLPRDGPDQLSLRVAVDTVEELAAGPMFYTTKPKEEMMRIMTDKHGVLYEKDRAIRLNTLEETGGPGGTRVAHNLWDEMVLREELADASQKLTGSRLLLGKKIKEPGPYLKWPLFELSTPSSQLVMLTNALYTKITPVYPRFTRSIVNKLLELDHEEVRYLIADECALCKKAKEVYDGFVKEDEVFKAVYNSGARDENESQIIPKDVKVDVGGDGDSASAASQPSIVKIE